VFTSYGSKAEPTASVVQLLWRAEARLGLGRTNLKFTGLTQNLGQL
jgi:hypothetical protein